MIYLNLPEVSGANKEIGQNMGNECQPTKTNLRPASKAGAEKELDQNPDAKLQPVKIEFNENRTTTERTKRAVRTA